MARHWRHPLLGVGQRNLYVKNAGRLIRPLRERQDERREH